MSDNWLTGQKYCSDKAKNNHKMIHNISSFWKCWILKLFKIYQLTFLFGWYKNYKTLKTGNKENLNNGQSVVSKNMTE